MPRLRLDLDITPELERALRTKFGDTFRAAPLSEAEFRRRCAEYIASLFARDFSILLADQEQLDAAEKGRVQ